MQGCYDAIKDEVVAVLEKLLRTRSIVVEKTDTVLKALHSYSNSSADFADCLIERPAHDAGCTNTITFDKNAAKTAGMRLIT